MRSSLSVVVRGPPRTSDVGSASSPSDVGLDVVHALARRARLDLGPRIGITTGTGGVALGPPLVLPEDAVVGDIVASAGNNGTARVGRRARPRLDTGARATRYVADRRGSGRAGRRGGGDRLVGLGGDGSCGSGGLGSLGGGGDRGGSGGFGGLAGSRAGGDGDVVTADSSKSLGDGRDI